MSSSSLTSSSTSSSSSSSFLPITFADFVEATATPSLSSTGESRSVSVLNGEVISPLDPNKVSLSQENQPSNMTATAAKTHGAVYNFFAYIAAKIASFFSNIKDGFKYVYRHTFGELTKEEKAADAESRKIFIINQTKRERNNAIKAAHEKVKNDEMNYASSSSASSSSSSSFSSTGNEALSALIGSVSVSSTSSSSYTSEGFPAFLSDDLFEKAKLLLDHSNLEDLPRASAGKTPVYLPKTLPIVLKHSDRGGPGQGKRRLEEMELARKICEQNNYNRLTIPKGCLYKEFLIETRVPLEKHDFKAQVGLYIENRDKFTNAVKEFTGFLFQSSLSDITDTRTYSTRTYLGRYDNVALYLEKEQGKIGLIDLEHFEPIVDKSSAASFKKCLDAIALFPLHFEEILTIAKAFDPRIKDYLKKLEESRDEVLKRFKEIYYDHLSFIKTKKIPIENPAYFEKISLARKKSIYEALKSDRDSDLWHPDSDLWLKSDYAPSNLNNNDLKIVFNLFEIFKKNFEDNFSNILDLITTFIAENLQKNVKAQETISTYRQLICARSITDFPNDEESPSPYYSLKKKIVSKLNLNVNISEMRSNFFIIELKKAMALCIIAKVLKELVKGRELAAYYPRNLNLYYNDPLVIFC